MTESLHLVLKFPVNYKISGGSTDTITEHKNVFDTHDRLVWGQFSNKDESGVSEKNRKTINEKQIRAGVDSFTFFLANNKGKRELFVGKLNKVIDRKQIPTTSPLIKYIPSYYSGSVGTPAESMSVFVDVSTFIKIDNKLVDEITLASNKKRVLDVKNARSVFIVNITENLHNIIADLIMNPEENFQYQIEQVDIPEDVTVEDKPKDKPSKKTGSGKSSYQRDPKTSKTAIVTANYKCEIDASHLDFISRATGENYVEAHHLIPMEYQEDFSKSVDVEANIVSLCVSCHKKLHHAEYKVIQPLIEKLYDDRIDRLEDCEIGLKKIELLSYYK